MAFEFSQAQKDHTVRQLKLLEEGRLKYAGDPRLYEIEYNKALILLANGELEAGWKLFHHRFDLPRS